VANVCVGDCLTVSPTGVLGLGTTTWPYACPDTNGTGLYCGSDGLLKGPPEKKVVSAWLAEGATVVRSVASSPCGVMRVLTQRDNALTLTNTDMCRDMLVMMDFGALLRVEVDPVDVTNPPVTVQTIDVRGEYMTSLLGTWLPYQSTEWTQEPGSTAVGGTTWPRPVQPVVLPAGQTLTVSTRVTYTCFGAVAGKLITSREPMSRLIGWT
jgi:hypothetical protein